MSEGWYCVMGIAGRIGFGIDIAGTASRIAWREYVPLCCESGGTRGNKYMPVCVSRTKGMNAFVSSSRAEVRVRVVSTF